MIDLRKSLNNILSLKSPRDLRKLSSGEPPIIPDGALVDANENYILDYQGNYIITTEV